MALLKEFELDGGVVLSDAYHRISIASLEKPLSVDGTSYDRVNMSVDIYRDESARQAGLNPVRSYKFDAYPRKDGTDNPEFEQYFGYAALDGTNTNIVSQSYGYLKTQNDVNGMDVNIDYTDSTDV